MWSHQGITKGSLLISRRAPERTTTMPTSEETLISQLRHRLALQMLKTREKGTWVPY
ncbi:hypothetical protein HanRHA438_Chr01g0029641 [Helianthus annuus]|nr:hypothetical protein HanRHA438_Chr01g0029641 [Helianthus annuus]